MKTLICTLNAKYIHWSLAVRLLYVANKDKFDVSFKEFTIKEQLDVVVDNILQTDCDILAIGVYIWNVEQTRQLIVKLKDKHPSLIIILGGPEVSYQPDYFLENWLVDYVISGEGEFVLGQLIQAIETNILIDLPGVSQANKIDRRIAQADLERLALLDSPYQLDEDRADLKNKIMYFETSRGCPYQCAYCLSSLEKGVRYLPKSYIFENLNYLITNGAQTIKFLDRTFNLNKTHTLQIFNFMIEHYRANLSCQFEIYADLLPDELITYLNNVLPDHYFRFEIGIQSIHAATNNAVNRKQNFDLIAHKVKQIQIGNKIALHLDLIAGLPLETFDMFIQSFNHVFELYAKELQLGFLKMLRGTSLRKQAVNHQYLFEEKAPYQIISNKYISSVQLDRIHQVEHLLDIFWNSGRFLNSLTAIIQQLYPCQSFLFFDQLLEFCSLHQLIPKPYQLEHLYIALNSFALYKQVNIYEQLRLDYFANFKNRPNGNWNNYVDQSERKRLLYLIGQDPVFLAKHSLNRKLVEKNGVVDRCTALGCRLAVFNHPEGVRFTDYMYTYVTS